MKTFSIKLALAVFAAGCAGAPSDADDLSGHCSALFEGDADLRRILLGDSTELSIETFCGCYARTYADKGEETQSHRTVLAAMTAIQTRDKVGAERAASTIAGLIEADADAYSFTAVQLERVGDDFNIISEQLSDAGKCAV